MKLVLLMLVLASFGKVTFADECVNGHTRNGSTVGQILVDPNSVVFSVQDHTTLVARMTAAYTYREYYFSGVCAFSWSESDYADQANLIRQAMAVGNFKVYSNVSPSAWFYQNPFALAANPATEKQVVENSGPDETIQISYSNPILRTDYEDCLKQKQLAIASGKQLVLQRRFKWFDVPACSVAP